MVEIIFSVAAALTLWFSPAVFAQDFRPEELPPQRAITLLKATNARDIYYLLTTSETTADTVGSNHYLLVLEHGKLRLPRQKTGVVYFDGGTIDLQFENGERLVVPTDRMPIGYLGVAHAPMMMSADRAPYMLKRIKINDAILKRLGFMKFIAPRREVLVGTAAYRDDYIPFVSPDTVQIIEFDPGEKLGYKLKGELVNLINHLDPARIKTDDRVNSGAFYGYGETILIVITDPAVSLPMLTEKLKGRGQLQLISQSLLNAYSDKFAKIKADQVLAGEKLKLADIQSIFQSLGQLERYYLMVEKMAKYEAAVVAHNSGVNDSYVGTYENVRAARLHPFYETILTKIRTIARYGYETLDQIGHPAAQEILTHTAQEFDFVALDIVRGKASVGGSSYFDLWLKFMLSDLNFIDHLDDKRSNPPTGVRMTRQFGNVFQDLKISGELKSVAGMGLVPHFIDDRPTFLLSLLGFSDQEDDLQTALIQFIIDADKQAAKFVAWSDRVTAAQADNHSPHKNFAAKGLANIKALLTAMASTPYGLRSVDGFSVSEYQESVLAVFTTLFDIAPVSLKTTGTMAALINSSIHILNDVKNDYAIRNRTPRPDVEKAAHALENRLRIFLQRSVESLAGVDHQDAVSSCELLLSPNAAEKSRSRW